MQTNNHVDERILPFNAASRELAEAAGLPILIPSGSFVADASVAWVIEAVEEWQERTQIPRFDPGWFHASSLGQTDEALLRQYRGELGDHHTAGTLRIFDNGHGRDGAWKNYLKESGLSIAGDTEDKTIRIESIRLTGECDDIVRRPLSTDEPVVLEFKTINPYAFNGLQESKPEHVLQVHAYMAGLALHEAIVLYENKGNQALKAFRVPFSVETWASITIRLRRLIREAGPRNPVKASPSKAGSEKAAALQM